MKYTCDNHHPVHDARITGGIAEAAAIFAKRKARQMYGPRGECRVCTQTACRQDGSMAEYSAFLGLPGKDGTTTGCNVSFAVYVSNELW